MNAYFFRRLIVYDKKKNNNNEENGANRITSSYSKQWMIAFGIEQEILHFTLHLNCLVKDFT